MIFLYAIINHIKNVQLLESDKAIKPLIFLAKLRTLLISETYHLVTKTIFT